MGLVPVLLKTLCEPLPLTLPGNLLREEQLREPVEMTPGWEGQQRPWQRGGTQTEWLLVLECWYPSFSVLFCQVTVRSLWRHWCPVHLSALAVAPLMLLDSRHDCSEECTEPSPCLEKVTLAACQTASYTKGLDSSARIVADHKKKHFVHSIMFVSFESIVAAGGVTHASDPSTPEAETGGSPGV